MKKTLLTVAGAAIFVAALLVAVYLGAPATTPAEPEELETSTASADYKNATFTMVDGTTVTLVEGVFEQVLENDMATKVTIRHFGNELFTDLNNDSREDVVFLITEDRGGSGTFFYVVGALNTPEGYVGTDAVLLGDRIALQTISPSQNPNHENVIVVNYAERAAGEPMTVMPSVGQSLYLKLDQNNRWGVVEPDFAGEADPGRMSLTMKTWVWQESNYNDGRTVTPMTPGAFTLTFAEDGSVGVGTDCNSVGGTYLVDGDRLTFTEMRTTLMYCDSSQESEFLALLNDTTMYHFTSRGELILDLKFDSGTVTFR